MNFAAGRWRHLRCVLSDYDDSLLRGWERLGEDFDEELPWAVAESAESACSDSDSSG